MARSMALRSKMRYGSKPAITPRPVSGGLHSSKRKASAKKSTKKAAAMSFTAAIAKGK